MHNSWLVLYLIIIYVKLYNLPLLIFIATGANVSSMKENIVRILKNFLDEHNPHVKAFGQARDKFDLKGGENFKLRLIDGRA